MKSISKAQASVSSARDARRRWHLAGPQSHRDAVRRYNRHSRRNARNELRTYKGAL